MKTKNLAPQIIAILCFCALNAHAQESADLKLAEVAITADITMSTSPNTRYHCSETPCLGSSQAELGLALISARNTENSVKSLSELIRFKLDGGLSEDYDCAVLSKRKAIRKWVASLKPLELRQKCVGEYLFITKSNVKIFPPSSVDFVCRAPDEIATMRQRVLEMIDTGQNCPP